MVRFTQCFSAKLKLHVNISKKVLQGCFFDKKRILLLVTTIFGMDAHQYDLNSKNVFLNPHNSSLKIRCKRL